MWGRNQINIPETVRKCVYTQRFFSSHPPDVMNVNCMNLILVARLEYYGETGTSLPQNSLRRYDVTLIRITPATVMLAQRCCVQPA